MRKEIKIPLNKNFKNIFNDWSDFKSKLLKTHDNRIVTSVYYDDDNFSLANDNFSGISNRKKFRIRWYNELNEKYTYEVKKKKNNLGTKIIMKSQNKDSNFEKLFSLHNHVFYEKKNKYFLKQIDNLNLKPKIQISYSRSYYLYNGRIRVTFDQDLKYKDKNKFNLNNNIIDDQFNIIEIKFEPEKTEDALKLLEKTKFYPKRFSKYLRGLHLLGIANYI